MISCFALTVQFSWKGEDGNGYTKIIAGDGKGLYMYLPAIFITQDLDIQTADDRFIFKAEGGGLNKYFAGTAISILPFFVGGYTIAAISDAPADGYSEPFQKAVSIAALFYLCIGLIFMSRLLQLYEIKPFAICAALLLTVFGTNLLVYSVYHPAFSHVYSFAFVSMFLLAAKKFSDTQSRKYLLVLAFSLGMIVIIRPTNGVIVFMIPFLAGSFTALKETFRTVFKLKNVLPATFIFLAVICIQLYLWYVQTGNPFVWSYRNEGFYFSDPQIVNVLFSFRKGWLLYTPIVLLAFTGLIVAYRKSRFQFYSLLLFFILVIYITASWWCWYYGPSFGQRSFIEFYAIIGLLLAVLLNEIAYRKTILAIAIVLTVFNLVQSFQYVKNILSSWNMDAEKYKYVFLKTSEDYYSCLGGCDDMLPYSQSQTLLLDTQNDYEKPYDSWSKSILKVSNGNSIADFSGKEFNSELEIIADDETVRHRLLYAGVQLKYMETAASGKEGPVMAVTLSDKYNHIYHYYPFAMNGIPNDSAHVWKTGHYMIEIPHMRSAGDHLKIYVWNKYNKVFYLDDFRVQLYGID